MMPPHLVKNLYVREQIIMRYALFLLLLSPSILFGASASSEPVTEESYQAKRATFINNLPKASPWWALFHVAGSCALKYYCDQRLKKHEEVTDLKIKAEADAQPDMAANPFLMMMPQEQEDHEDGENGDERGAPEPGPTFDEEAFKKWSLSKNKERALRILSFFAGVWRVFGACNALHALWMWKSGKTEMPIPAGIDTDRLRQARVNAFKSNVNTIKNTQKISGLSVIDEKKIEWLKQAVEKHSLAAGISLSSYGTDEKTTEKLFEEALVRCDLSELEKYEQYFASGKDQGTLPWLCEKSKMPLLTRLALLLPPPELKSKD
jgi:hypothetical protein